MRIKHIRRGAERMGAGSAGITRSPLIDDLRDIVRREFYLCTYIRSARGARAPVFELAEAWSTFHFTVGALSLLKLSSDPTFEAAGRADFKFIGRRHPTAE